MYKLSWTAGSRVILLDPARDGVFGVDYETVILKVIVQVEPLTFVPKD